MNLTLSYGTRVIVSPENGPAWAGVVTNTEVKGGSGNFPGFVYVSDMNGVEWTVDTKLIRLNVN